jgi:hypothetical protein
VVGFLVRDGKVRRWRCPASGGTSIGTAPKKFTLVGDDVYEDDDAVLFAEDGM